MRITGNYTGGNIRVLKTEGDMVLLDNEMRDTVGSWFYWAFRIEGAQGRRLHFVFNRCMVGYWGAAVSKDGRNWRWSEGADRDGAGFTYVFGEDEDTVFFCHDMNYPYERFLDFAEEKKLELSVLTTSEGGRDVPLVRLGTGGSALLLTSRHHCCESPGTYLLEGMLREFTEHPPKGFRVLAVPFMDLDGSTPGTCVHWFSRLPGMKLSAAIESTYAGNYYRKVSTDNLTALGACAARAMRKIIGG